MEKELYSFNYSQDIIHLQTKYALFKRVANILFAVSFDGGFDEELMKKALQLLVARNDCLRITFIKDGKTIKQYFDEKRTLGDVPSKKFSTNGQMEAFILRFRKTMVDVYKGRTFEPVFVTDPSGKQQLFIKISHYVADTYGIGVLVNDLGGIYTALRDGKGLPPEPGKFEDILRKDAEYRANTEATEKDLEFFKEYYGKRLEQRPCYLGIHGDDNDRWLKYKRKGNYHLPYLFVKCDTKGYRFVIPASVCTRVAQWCEATGISMNTFFFYACSVACSLKNGRFPYQIPLELLNCRATVTDKKAAGTKVQSLNPHVSVDYKKSFTQNAKELFEEQTELYRHTKMSYLENEGIIHGTWNIPMTGSSTGFCFSFIPMAMPEGVKLQVYSNGKGALVTYMALIYDVNTNEVVVTYDVQTRMVTPEQLIEFQNLYTHVVEAVLDRPDEPLEKLF